MGSIRGRCAQREVVYIHTDMRTHMDTHKSVIYLTRYVVRFMAQTTDCRHGKVKLVEDEGEV